MSSLVVTYIFVSIYYRNPPCPLSWCPSLLPPSLLIPFPHQTFHLVTTITDPYLTVLFNHYFDDRCPFEALYKAYLQIEHLSITINSPFTTRNSIALTIKHIAHDVQTQLQAELASVMHQLGMTDFIINLDRYLKELASTQNLIKEATASKNSTPSTSSSPLTQEEQIAIIHTKVWWTDSNNDVSLAHNHPCYHETCFQYRKLRHIHVNCYLYQCSTCLKTSPCHIQAHCPLKCHMPSQQALYSSSTDGGPSHHPQHSSCMVTIKPCLTSCISSAHHSHSSSLTYVNDEVTNKTWDNLDNEPTYNTYEF